MAQLFMDTDQLRNSMGSIHIIHGQMSEQIQGLTQQIELLVGSAWQSPSAVNFGNDYSYCQETMMSLLGELEGLIIDVNREITEWEETANSFSRSAGGYSQVANIPRYFPFLG